jgi:hypothetical protein
MCLLLAVFARLCRRFAMPRVRLDEVDEVDFSPSCVQKTGETDRYSRKMYYNDQKCLMPVEL